MRPRLAALLSAVAILPTAAAFWGAASATAASYNPDLPRSAGDRADDATGAQVHVLYVLPSDGTDRSLDTDSTLRNTVSSFQTWLESRTGDRGMRIDTYQGSLDVSFLRLGRSDATLASYGLYIRDEIEKDTKAAGFNDPNKIYAVYYDGTANDSCGGGAYPPGLPGDVAALYLKGMPNGAVPCSNNRFAAAGAAPGYLEISMLHEIMHTIGFVPACAPHQTRSGHVSDSQDDLTWAGDAPWAPSGFPNVQLDVNNDDYYRTGSTSCMDLDTSPYLMGNSGAPIYPPTSPSPQPQSSPTATPAPTASPTASQSSAAVAPSVSLSPDTINAGQRVAVLYSGTPGSTLQILSRTQPATEFSVIGTVTLDQTGSASSSHAPQKNTRITARVLNGDPSADQPLIQVRSVASMSAKRVGTRAYSFTGRVYPAHSGRLVTIYRNGVLAAQGRCDASGIYTITRTFGAGTFSFQARTASDTYNVGTTSTAQSVRIY